MDPITVALALASQFAPALVKRLTSSDTAGAVTSQVIDIARTVTGKADPGDMLDAVKADPALGAEFQKLAMNLDADLEKAYLADRQNARSMQVAALTQDDVFSKRFVFYFSTAWSIFAMVYFACVTFCVIPATGQRTADTILGVLIGSILGSIFQFFYGTNRQSQVKDATINNLTK
ncbi:MAG: hypothetical protein ACRYGK_19115 [Janthinobacterium lividum]